MISLLTELDSYIIDDLGNILRIGDKFWQPEFGGTHVFLITDLTDTHINYYNIGDPDLGSGGLIRIDGWSGFRYMRKYFD